jgi:hypothetical protein
MLGLEILDVALGLVLVYLLMSLIMTAVRETIESWRKSRAVQLERAIGELLQGDTGLLTDFYNHPLIYGLHRGQRRSATIVQDAGTTKRAPGTLTGLNRHDLPSYIPRETFAAALLDLLGSGRITHQQLDRAFYGLDRLSGGNLQLVRRELEDWYDGAMDRASGWYRRRTQHILLVLGLAVSLLLNVNSIVIGRHLAVDEQARVYTDRLAEQITQQGQPQTSAQIEVFRSQLDQVGLPIGWSDAARAAISASFPTAPDGWSDNRLEGRDIGFALAWLGALLSIAAGYAITAFAMMLGAPFWFDVLNRIMVIRSTVKPKEKSPDEPGEDGVAAKDESAPTGGRARPLQGANVPDAGQASPDPGGTRAQGEATVDGCVEDIELRDDEVTEDVELPAASGGVEKS